MASSVEVHSGQIADGYERALLAGLMWDPEHPLPPLLADEFFLERHRVLWTAMSELVDLGVGHALPAVTEHLRQQARLEEAGGLGGIVTLFEEGWLAIPSLLTGYAEPIRAAATARAVRRLGEELAGTGMPAREIQDRLDALPAPVSLASPRDRWREVQARWGKSGLQIGLPDVDRKLGGLFPGDLVVVGGRTSHGKALALETLLPTPVGWTTMGEVQVGDRLIGADGFPSEVIYASPVLHGRRCYKVAFSDGSTIVADAEHQWLTWTRAARRSQLITASPARNSPLSRDQRHKAVRPGLVTTEEIAASLRHLARWNHSISVCAPLQAPEARLPVNPYVLGVWLGDGTTASGRITSADSDLVAAVEATGQAVRRHHDPLSFGLPGLQAKLRVLGVLGRKHIPALYLRSAESQRRAVLAGLLDTDGTVLTEGAVGLDVTCRELAETARELICSLGYRCTMSTRRVRGRSLETSTCYRLRFATSDKVFTLLRKARTLEGRRASHYVQHRTDRRMIVAMTPISSVPVRCVQVSATDGLYLAGRSWIPTHNTATLVSMALHAAVQEGFAVAYLTLEMSAAAVFRRFLGARARLRLVALRGGALGASEFELADQTAEWLSTQPVAILDAADLRGKGADRLLLAAGAAEAPVVVIDHLQEVVTEAGESRAYELGRFVGGLKDVAIRRGKVIFLAAQLLRQADERKGPALASLKESGGIEEKADVVLLLDYPIKRGVKDAGEEDLIVYVAKNRDGPTGRVRVRILPEYGLVLPLGRQPGEEPAWVRSGSETD